MVEQLPKLYNTDSAGKVRVWWIEVDTFAGRYRSFAGLVGGKAAASGWTMCEPKNVGTKIETTPGTQAQAEAAAEYTKKRHKGWTDDEQAAGKLKPFAPMLAQTWSGKKHGIRHGKTFSQPKLDGMRVLGCRHGLFSRNWKPILTLPHIYSALQPIFEDYPDLIIDGEGYAHRLADNFEEMLSIIKRPKPTREDLEKSAEFAEFHVFDLYHDSHTFTQRQTALQRLLHDYRPKGVVPVATSEVIDDEHMEHLFAIYMEQGYEGQMIRYDTPYENKRSHNLLKRKEFKTEEFRLKRIEQGNGNWLGCAKRVVLYRPEGNVGPKGEDEFEASMRGSQKFARELLERAPSLVGTWTTIRFQNYTQDGVPRFGVAIEFDRTDHL